MKQRVDMKISSKSYTAYIQTQVNNQEVYILFREKCKPHNY